MVPKSLIGIVSVSKFFKTCMITVALILLGTNSSTGFGDFSATRSIISCVSSCFNGSFELDLRIELT